MSDCAVGLDFAIAAYREEGVWTLVELEPEHVASVDSLERQARRFPADGGVLILISVDDDFCVLARVTGPRTELLLSDVSAATQWPMARAVTRVLGVEVDPNEEDVVPAGNLAILADWGVSSLDLALLLDDPDAFPDEILGEVAEQLGFGQALDELIGVSA